jgi:hypothetical protein
MKRLLEVCLLSVLLFIFVTTGEANKNPEFYKGTVRLLSGDTLTCQLRFTRKVSEGLIQVFNDGKFQVLTVKDVSSFVFFDEAKKTTRTFLNVALKPEFSTRRHEVFVEILHSNDLLAIVNHRTIGYSKKSFQFNPFRKKTVIDNLYLLDKTTTLIMPLSKENVLAMMKENKASVTNYVESAALKFKQLSDYATLLEYQQTLR